MARKHFETNAQQRINDGRLIRLGLQYYVRYMSHSDVPHSLALQEHVMDTLRQLGKTHYIIEKDADYLRRHLNKGNAIVGTFVPGAPGGPDRLAAHMMVVYPSTAKEAGLADSSVLPDRDINKISVVANILVHEDFRGNRLMQQMLQEWLKMAAADGKTHAIAEVCVDNQFSWSVFLDCGFVIYASGHDDRDGSDLVYVHKPLNREFVYSADPKDLIALKLFTADGALDTAAHEKLKTLLKQGFHALDFDKRTSTLLLAKCIGTAPLARPSAPGNDNRGPT